MILLEAFLRGVIVIAIAGVLSVALRNRSATLRHHVWATAIVIQLALLAFVPVMPGIRVPMVPAYDPFITEAPIVATTREQAEPEPPSSPLTAAPATQANAIASASPAAPARSALDWRKIALIVWAIGAVIILLRYLLGTILMARIAQRGERVDDGKWLSLAQRTASELGITRPVTLLWGEKLAVPVTWGVLYPMILLPESAHDWPVERRRFVLVHEMAHVKRFDALTQLLSQLALALFWFSPMMWLADWRMRVEREHACDDAVLQHGTEPTLYADELLDMVRGLVSRKTARPAFAALAMARRSEFEGRMLAILDPHRARSTSGIGSGAAFALLSLLIAAPLAAIDPFSAAIPTEVASRAEPKSSANADTLFTCQAADLHQEIELRHTNSRHKNPDANYVEVKRATGSSCLTGALIGPVRVADNMRDVELRGRGSQIRVHELTKAGDRRFELKRDADGNLTRVFRHNGRIVAPDDEWLERMLRQIMEVVRHTTPSPQSEPAAGGIAAAAPWYKTDTCDMSRTSTSTHVLVSDDTPPITEIDIKLERPGRCVIADIDGRVVLTEGEQGVADMSPGSHVRLREIKPGLDHSVRIERPRNGGPMETSFFVNGVATPDNRAAQALIARILPEAMRESGENADTRVALLLRAHGLQGTLATIASIGSPNARTIHYLSLAKAKRWSDAELSLIAGAASRGMRGATTDSARVMQALPKSKPGAATDVDMLEQVWSDMASESDARAAMMAHLPTADHATLLMMMRVASQFRSGLEASTLLMAAAPHYLRARDTALENAWFAATSTLTSSRERTNALLTAVRYVRGNPRIKAAIVKSAAGMSSERDQTTVLTALANAS